MNEYAHEDGYNRSGWIETYTGRAFQPMNPKPHLISTLDIAHALSNKCRYSGHSSEFYSVAEHSVLMARWSPQPVDARWCLLHDAVEAYLPDVPRPLKPHIPGWSEIEARVQTAVAERFGLTLPMPSVVKEIDTRILLTEAADLLLSQGDRWGIEATPLPVTLYLWSPERAYTAFMEIFTELFPLDEDPPHDTLNFVLSPDFNPYAEMEEA